MWREKVAKAHLLASGTQANIDSPKKLPVLTALTTASRSRTACVRSALRAKIDGKTIEEAQL